MISDIERKLRTLNPDGQSAVLAFMEFLLARQSEKEQQTADRRDLFEDSDADLSETHIPRRGKQNNSIPKADLSEPGIIMADECVIQEENTIDFADINLRFNSDEKETGSGKKRERKIFDWL